MNTAAPKAPSSATRIYRVGDLRVDVGQQRVTRADLEIPLPKLSFDLLLVLIRRAPDIISNDELMALVWPGIVVSPETISQRVKLLRDALGDEPRNPRYITGLRGRGYRLLAPVADGALELSERVTQSDAGAPVEPPARVPGSAVSSGPNLATENRFIRGRIWILLALAGVTVALLAAGLLSQHRAASSSRPTSVVVEALPPRSVAVLPFVNISVEHGDDYIGLGLAEMVLNRLSNVPELLVIARTSSFAFRDKNVDAREIARKLNARYLIEGSVQRAGSHLRVGAQLIDAETGRQFKAMQFDRDVADIFKVQDDIAEQVAAALEVSLGGLDTRRPDGARNVNFDAYLAYLQGRALLNHWRVSDAASAIEQFSRAIAIDPSFAAAYAGLAEAQYQTASLGGKSTQALHPEVAIDKALALDGTLGEAYVMRARMKVDAHDPAGAEADFRKGIALSPSYGTGYAQLAEFLSESGRTEEALQMIDRAILVDPMMPRHYYLKALFAAGRGDDASLAEAEALMLRVLEIDPSFSPAMVRLGGWRWDWYGQTAEGIKLTERALRLDPKHPWIRLQLCLMYLDVGDLGAADNVIAEGDSTAPSGLIAPAMYRGDWRAAAELAYSKPKAQLFDAASLFAIFAIQDHALKTGEFDRAIQYLYQAYQLPAGHEMDGTLGDVFGITLAQLYRKKGDEGAAHTLTREIQQFCAKQPDASYVCAVGQIFAGEREAALESLRKASAQPGGLPQYWWYLFDREPVLAEVRSDPSFQAIVRSQRDLAEHQRTLLEQMRAKGEVPPRPAAAAQPGISH